MRRLLLAVVLASACIKPKPPVLAQAGTEVAAAIVRADPASADVVMGPERLVDGVMATFAERGLSPRVVPAAELADLFDGAPSTAFRIERLAGWAADADLAVLVETDTLYISQLAGRYRWEVMVTVTVQDLDAERAIDVEQFKVPVFLQFYRQREEAAVAEATAIIQRRLGEMLDEMLIARQGG